MEGVTLMPGGSRVRVVLVATAAVVGGLLATARPVPALAAQIVQPSSPKVVATLDSSGTPLAVTIVASGFRAGALVYVEQCDGVASTTPSWSPTVHCDLGSSPSPAIADGHGVARFPSTDRNRAFRPFIGESPQSLFNCLARSQVRLPNALPSFSNCTLRVSTSNTVVTADQTFLPLVLTTTRAATPTTTPATTIVAAKPASGSKESSAGEGSAPAKHATPAGREASAVASGAALSVTREPGTDLLSLSDPTLATGYTLVLCGLLIATLTIALRRRHSAPRHWVTGTQTTGER